MRVALQRRRSGIHQEQIDVLLAGEPHDVLAAPGRGERRCPRGESSGQQLVAVLGKSRSGGSEVRRRDDASDDQHVRGLRGRQGLGEAKERVEPGQRPRHDQERAFRHRCLGRRRLPRSLPPSPPVPDDTQASGQLLQVLRHPPTSGGLKETERPESIPADRPINHHVAGHQAVDPDKPGRPRNDRTHRNRRTPQPLTPGP